MLTTDNTALVIVDIQQKLLPAVADNKEMAANCIKLIKGLQLLEVPIIWVEQMPDKIGGTIPEIAELLNDSKSPITKSSFSCCGNDQFLSSVAETKRENLLVIGIEAHVCVYQTVAQLLQKGYNVEVIEDGISSRATSNKETAIRKMNQLGAKSSSVEMALFELMQDFKHPNFKQVSKIIV